MSKFNHWEESINDYQKQLWADGIAFVQKIPDPVNIVRHLGYGKVIGQLTSARWVDWGGFAPGGRSIWHESKETNHKTGIYASIFKPHQLSYLLLAGENGCISFITIRSSAHDICFAIPWKALAYLPLKWHELDDYMIDGPRWAEVIL